MEFKNYPIQARTRQFAVDVGYPCPNCKKKRVWCEYGSHGGIGNLNKCYNPFGMQANVLISSTDLDLNPESFDGGVLRDICTNCGTIVTCQNFKPKRK